MRGTLKFRGRTTAYVLLSAAVLCLALISFDVSFEVAVIEAAAVVFAAVCVSALMKALRRKQQLGCELCQRSKMRQTDNTAWARRHGLEVCNNCAFKLQIVFNNVEAPPSDDRVIH